MPRFIGRASKVAPHRYVPPVAPSISIDPFNLAVGTKPVTIRAEGGITHIGWAVFADQPPSYPWYSEGVDNVALTGGAVTVSVTTFAAGDRVKAYKSAASPLGPASRDFSVQPWDSEPAT